MRRFVSSFQSSVRAHPVVASVVVVVVIAAAVPAANYFLSPLWTRTTLQEASPLDRAAPERGSGTASVSAPAQASTATGGRPAPVAGAATGASVTTLATPAATAAAATSAAGVGQPSTPAATPAALRVVARGMFAGADDFHFGRGDALLIEVAPQRYTLRFENFSVRNGPDLFVYLSDDAGGYGKTVLKLGGLRATDGAFNYEVPAGTDVTRFRSAIVWCDQFSQLFATAPLH